MNSTFSDKPYSVPTRKIIPPGIPLEKFLWRANLLDSLRHLQVHKKKVVSIEAPAGSGKSIFARQYIQDADCSFGWCQLDSEDQDPIVLLNVLVTLLSQTLSGYNSNTISPALSEGAVHYSEAQRFGAILANEISEVAGHHQFLLVLDDLHLIEDSQESTELLMILIQSSPSWIQWVLVSRHPVKSVLRVNQFNMPSLRIEHNDLDFSVEESAQLFQSIFGLTLPITQIQTLQQQTEGWITALVLVALRKVNKGDINFDTNWSATPSFIRRHLAEYFLQEVLVDVSQECLHEIFQLVLLEEVPLSVVCSLFGEDAGKELVRDLNEKNRFFRCIDESEEVFSFHHLFRDSIRSLAEKKLPNETQERVYKHIISYHLKRQEALRALHYAVYTRNVFACEEILSQFGFELLHLNQVKTLYRILKNILGKYDY